MALDVGEIIIDEFGDVTGSGLSLAIYNGALQALDVEDRRDFADAMKPFSEGIAAAIIGHFTANAEVTVTVGTGDAGLQKTPNPNQANTPTVAPAAPVVLGTKGTIE